MKRKNEKTSLPSPSVPIKWLIEGGNNIEFMSIKFGSYGAIIGAINAKIKIVKIIIKPDSARGFLKKIFI